MERLYRRVTTHQDVVFGILVLFITLLIYIVGHPKASATMWQLQRQTSLNSFLQQVMDKQTLDVQDYWRFREFYSPGYFTFNPDTVGVSSTLKIKQVAAPTSDLLYFHSPMLTSTDELISTVHLPFPNDITQPQIIFQDPTTVIYRKNEKEIDIVFIRPVNEMMRANGFFDYTVPEREQLRGFYWLNTTTIKI
jgi:hypothetical protein